MSVVAAIREMLANGLSVDQALMAAEAFERANAPPPPTARQERNRRYYEARKTRLKVSEIKTIETIKTLSDEELPPLKEIPPIPPKENNPPNTGRERVGARAGGGSRLPTEWAPSAALVAFAGDLGIVGQGFDEAAAEFRDYWRAVPGQRGRKLDWDATFRNRLRETAGRKKVTAHGNGKGSIVEAGRALIRRVDEEYERRLRPSDSRQAGDPIVRVLPSLNR
jgi:hypothetical protein